LKNKIKKNIGFIFNLGLGLIGGLLGAYGGADGTSKLYRRVGIPILLIVMALIKIRMCQCVFLGAIFLPLTLGYGIPEPPNVSNPDKGSTLGRFWYNIIFKSLPEYKRHFFSDIATRGTISSLICLSLITIPILKGNWVLYLWNSLFIKVVYCGLSWRNLGGFKFLGKNLTFAEMITYSAITYSAISLM